MKDNEKRESVGSSGLSGCYVSQLELALRIIATWAACDSSSPDSREKAMQDIHDKAMETLKTKAT
jgi:hypothetical protein